MTKNNTTKNVRNVDAALSILKGTTVLAHDRRRPDASAIAFTSYRRKGVRVLRPSYGISNTLLTTLSKLANRVTFDGGMPSFHFSL